MLDNLDLMLVVVVARSKAFNMVFDFSGKLATPITPKLNAALKVSALLGLYKPVLQLLCISSLLFPIVTIV